MPIKPLQITRSVSTHLDAERGLVANATLQRGAGGLGFDSVIIPNEDIKKCSLKGHCFYHEGVVIRAYFKFMKENASCPGDWEVPSVGDMLVPKSTSRNIEEMPRNWTQPTESIALVIGFAIGLVYHRAQ